MAYDPMTQRVVLFGGYNNGTAFNDTWTWDGSDWTEQNPSVSPSARYGDMISYNDSSGSIVLYGGQANGLASSLLSDTWTWDGSNWGQLPTAASPGPRSFAALNQQEGILFGDDGGGIVVNDCKEVTTWQVGASGWNELSTSSPPPGRTAPVMVYDPLSGSSIMFGGTGCVTNYLGDTWIFNGPTIITTRTSIAASTKQPRVGQLVTFTARVRPVPGGGKVNFFDNGDIIPGCTLVTVHISTGNAYCKVAFPSTGSYEIRTVYSGDQNYASSTSGIVTETPVTTLPSRFLNLSMGPAGCWSSAVARRKL